MAVVRLLYSNLGRDGVWYANSYVPTLPACHLADANRQRVWRSTGTGTCDNVKVNTCSTALSVDRVALVSYNLTSSAALTIEANCTSCFDDGAAPPSFSTCFAPWASCRTGVCFVDLSARQTGKRWWRFVMCNTGNADGYYQVGVIALGPATCMIIDAQSLTYRVEDPSVLEYAPAGTPRTYERDPYAVVTLPHQFLSEALVFGGYGSLQDVLRSGGRRQDMVLSLYSSAPACSCAALATNLYGRFAAMPDVPYAGVPALYHASLQFRESL